MIVYFNISFINFGILPVPRYVLLNLRNLFITYLISLLKHSKEKHDSKCCDHWSRLLHSNMWRL